MGISVTLIILLIPVINQAQSLPSAHRADSLYQQGDFSGAVEAYHSLVQQWQEQNNTDSIHYYQFWEAKSHIQQYEYRPARDLLQAVLTPPLPDSALLSRVYHEIGYTYVGENDLKQAAIYSDRSIEVEKSRTNPDTAQLAKYYELKGFRELQAGNYPAAKQWGTTAHQLRKQVLDPMDKELGYSANTLYIILSQGGEWLQAAPVLSEAWEILSYNLPEDHPHIAILANNYSTLLMDIGDPQNAKEYLLKAISSNKKGERYYPLAANYVNLGLLYMNLNENQTAESYYQLAWGIVDTLLDYPDFYRANTLDALGAIYHQQERYDEADSMFLAAYAEKQDLYEPESVEIAQSMFNLGWIAEAREDWPLARQYFTKAEGIRRRVLGADHPKRADVFYELAEVAWNNQQTEEATKQWRNSLAIYRQSFGLPHHHSLENLIRLTEVFDELNHTDSIRHYLELAWASVTGQEQPISDWNVLDTLSIAQYTPMVLDLANVHLRLLLNQSDGLSADDRKLGRQVIALVHAWLPTFLSLFNDASLRQSVAEQIQDFYRQGAVLAHRVLQTSASDSAGWQSQLLMCIQASRGATIQAAFKDRQAIQFAGVPDSLVQQAQTIKQQLQFTMARQQSSEEQDESSQMAQQQLSILQSWQDLQQYLQRHYPQYYQARFEIPTIDQSEIQKSLTDREQVLAYFTMDTALLAVQIQPEGISSTWLSVARGWQDSLQVYQQLLQRQTEMPRQLQLGYFLYQQLWEPLKLPPQSHVKILSDGPLFYFNFETLLTREPTGATAAPQPWLIRDYCIYYGHTLPGTLSRSSDPSGEVLGIAPGFSQSLKSSYLSHLAQNQTPDSVFLRWLRTPWSTSFVQQFPEKGWGKALTEQEATETLFHQEAPQASILHFGTHARLENDKPLYSFLALTPEPGTQQDGYLYTYELYNEPLAAQLAVLTACETGLGSYRRGEGVLSLAHAFRYAGCPSVVYSLWSIDDQQSNQIASLFYENLKDNQSVAEALRTAKLAYLERVEGGLQSPYYWGGLVLTGDDQMVNLSTPLLSRGVIGAIAVAFGLGTLLIGWRKIRRRA